jgi:hypothetical protein
MKKILFLFLLMPSIVLSNPMVCVNGVELTELTNEYKEVPFVRGITSAGESLVIFVNPTTGSFTILERKDVDTYCALAVGVGFEPVPKQIQEGVREFQNQGTL